jgi:hypothetical protein
MDGREPAGSPSDARHAVAPLGGLADTILPQLPSEVLQATCSHLGSVRDLLEARRACAALRQPAADCVRALLAQDCDLPQEAWAVFRQAKALVVRPGEAQPGQLERLLALLDALPPRLEALRLQLGRGGQLLSPDQGEGLARTLQASSCSAQLQRLDIQQRLLPAAGAALAEGLPSLASLSLHLRPVVPDAGEADDEEEQPPPPPPPPEEAQLLWAPARLPAGLTCLRLRASFASDVMTQVDMARLAAARRLRALSVTGNALLLRGQALQQLSELTYLHLDCYDTQLQSYQYWELMGRLPQLQGARLDLVSLDLGRHAGVQLAQLTRLSTKELRIQEAEEQERQQGQLQGQLLGCLARALPRLQRLHVAYVDGQLQQLLRALDGLAGLEELQAAGDVMGQGWGEEQALLRGLPGLTSLRLAAWMSDVPHVIGEAQVAWGARMSARNVVRGAAGCAALRHLELDCSELHELGLEEVELLTGGACSGLERLVLRGSGGVGLAGVTALLGGGLPRLRELVVGSAGLAADAGLARGLEEPGRALWAARALAASDVLLQAVLAAAVAAVAAAGLAEAAAVGLLGPEEGGAARASSELLQQRLLQQQGHVAGPAPGEALALAVQLAQSAGARQLLQALLGALDPDLLVAWKGCSITIRRLWDDGTADYSSDSSDGE